MGQRVPHFKRLLEQHPDLFEDWGYHIRDQRKILTRNACVLQKFYVLKIQIFSKILISE